MQDVIYFFQTYYPYIIVGVIFILIMTIIIINSSLRRERAYRYSGGGSWGTKFAFIFFVIMMVLSFFLYNTYSKLMLERSNREYYQKQTDQNMSALKDSITVEFNKKLEAYEFSKDNYVLEKLEDLEKYNKELSDELTNIKGDIIGAIKSEVEGDLGGITATTTNLKIINPYTNYYGLTFKSEYKDAGFEQKLSGMSKFYVTPDYITKKWNIIPDSTVIDTNLTRINITYGFRELDDSYQVFALSPSPKIQLTDLTGGYFIDKQPNAPYIPRKWGIGPYVGFGISTGADTSTPRLGWSVGISFHYNLLEFNLNK
jgi:uncharacterized membrane protein